MRRIALPACLASALLLGGCVDNDYDRRSYAGDGWRGRSYDDGYRSGYGGYGYSSRYGYHPRYDDRYRRDHADRRKADDYYRDLARRDDDRPRLVRPERNVVCDRRTEVCYRKGEINAPETRERFGRDAARKVERVRERHDTKDVFLPRRNIVCNDENNTCYRNGKPDRALSRDYFGPKNKNRRNG